VAVSAHASTSPRVGTAAGAHGLAHAAGAHGEGGPTLVERAHAAKRAGDLAKAHDLYDAMLSRRPSDSEALTGLAEIERAHGNPNGAMGYYRRALASNPTFLPAMIGFADMLWEQGDRGGAQQKYAEIIERFPASMVPHRARQRTEARSAAR
jgi:tetratricopeptide (TPR) repeat protein